MTFEEWLIDTLKHSVDCEDVEDAWNFQQKEIDELKKRLESIEVKTKDIKTIVLEILKEKKVFGLEEDKWYRIRFKTNEKDYRPLKVPTPGPWWCSGYGVEYSIIIAYVKKYDQLKIFWPEAYDLDVQTVDKIEFTDRFPKPDDWDESKEKFIKKFS